MTKLIILGDSHDSLWPDFLEHLRSIPCDRILHLGDVCQREILRKFEQIAPVTAVRGNNDRTMEDLPPQRFFHLEGLGFYMIHDQRKAGRVKWDYDIFLSGHTHRYREMVTEQGKLYLNPGSCGRRRADDTVSYVEMAVDRGRWSLLHRTFCPAFTYSRDLRPVKD